MSGKTKSDIKVIISKALIDSYIIHKEFVSVNNVLREYNEMKKKKSWNLYVLYYIKNSSYVQSNVWKKWYRNNSR